MLDVTSIVHQKKSFRLVPLLALLGAGFFPASARAGTWTVVGIEWYPASSPGVGIDGGSIALDIPSKTISYGLHASATAPIYDSLSGWHNTATRNPVAMGTFRWLLDWKADYPGEPEALEGVATIEVSGTAMCSAGATDNIPGYSSSANASLNDPYYLGLHASATSGAVSVPINDTQNHPNNGKQTIFGGVGQIILTNDGSRHHTILMSINSGASLNAYGSFTYNGPRPNLAFINATATAMVSMDVTLKVVAIDGKPL